MAETKMKKQYRGCSRLHFAMRKIGEDGTVTYETPQVLAKCKTVSATVEQSREGVFADNKKQYNSKSGVNDVRTFDTFPIPEDVLAALFDDTIVNVADTVAYGINPDADEVEVAIGYALHDGDEDNPCELVWAFRTVAQQRPSTTSNTITTTDTASEGQQIAFDVLSPEKAWTTTGKKNPAIRVPVTASIDVDKWFAQVVTWDNISSLFPASQTT